MTKPALLVVLAHPDDETFICGGTIAQYAQAGHPVTLICATKGEMGRRLGVPPIATRATLPLLREQELRDACAALGIGDLRFLGLLDKTLDYYDPNDLAARVAPMIAELKPGAILTFHEVTGGHPDHCAIGRAATLAWQRSDRSARLYHLLWRDTAAQLAKVGAGQERVTTTRLTPAAVAAKVRAYRAHRTQSGLTDWLWGDDQVAQTKLAGPEFLLQGSGTPRPGEENLFGA